MSRLDRIEGIIEALANRQVALEEDHRRLLTAQIVIGDETAKFIKETRAGMTEVSASIARLAEAQAHTDERLNALIDYFQRHLDDHPRGKS
jgi:hypothetical protein